MSTKSTQSTKSAKSDVLTVSTQPLGFAGPPPYWKAPPLLRHRAYVFLALRPQRGLFPLAGNSIQVKHGRCDHRIKSWHTKMIWHAQRHRLSDGNKLDSGWLRKAKHVAKKTQPGEWIYPEKVPVSQVIHQLIDPFDAQSREGNLGLMATLCMPRSSWCPKEMEQKRVRLNVMICHNTIPKNMTEQKTIPSCVWT